MKDLIKEIILPVVGIFAAYCGFLFLIGMTILSILWIAQRML